jgi:hypothetical protein
MGTETYLTRYGSNSSDQACIEGNYTLTFYFETDLSFSQYTQFKTVFSIFIGIPVNHIEVYPYDITSSNRRSSTNIIAVYTIWKNWTEVLLAQEKIDLHLSEFNSLLPIYGLFPVNRFYPTTTAIFPSVTMISNSKDKEKVSNSDSGSTMIIGVVAGSIGGVAIIVITVIIVITMKTKKTQKNTMISSRIQIPDSWIQKKNNTC